MLELPRTQSLAGTWRFSLDPENKGIRERWFARALNERIRLPGTTDEAGFGEVTYEACADRLSRVRRYVGPAWYQTTVRIERELAGKKIFLFLERTKDSQVWVDESWIGSDDSLSASHEYDLSRWLTPGEHTITILVDNAKLPPVGPCHQVDERTQTNWNGIVGRIELRMHEPVWIRELQAYPDLAKRQLRVVGEVVNESGWSGGGGFEFNVAVIGKENQFDIPPVRLGKLINHGAMPIEANVPLPEDVPAWDEFQPTRLLVSLTVEAMPIADTIRDRRIVVCGLREFTTHRAQFVINGRPTLMRGKLDCAIFPRTGYAPMDKAEWLRLFSISKSYGINHYRFHSWCPPAAAFEAADELGIYLLAELPNKRGITAPENENYSPPKEAYETLTELEGDGGPPAVRTNYLKREGERILRQFGNHPSFVMFTLGNELGGDESVMKGLCDHFRALDSRHLYAIASGGFHWDLKLRGNDPFWVTRATEQGLPVRGASWESAGHIDDCAPSTMVDYRASLQGVPVPVIAHEIAQGEVYPDYSEIEKYDGVLKPKNLEIFRARLEKAGMLDQARAFCEASGKLCVICKREDIEAQLRTPGMGGFHLLDIQDFSGQGTALVGILDVFLDSKGLITPEQWREFCCETVPLLCMKKYTWTSNEVFRATVKVAHYGPSDLINQDVTWSLFAGTERIAGGTLRVERMPTGTVTDVDLIHASLTACINAQKLTLRLELPGTSYANTYELWVYPERIDLSPPPGVLITSAFTDEVKAALAKGDRVLLLPPRGTIHNTVRMDFSTGFWSCMFRLGDRKSPRGTETSGTQGFLCDPDHPVFSGFPTEFHSNWQWWHLVKNSDPMILDATPHSYRPVLQVIDGVDRNHKLGLILEAKVGPGKLLVCSIDLQSIQKQPEARQLLSCLYRYVGSAEFSPAVELDLATVESFL
jgi:hypothetical protein